MSHHKSIRTSKLQQEGIRFLNPNPNERNWVQRIPEVFPDVLRAPAVPYRSDRDDPRLRSNRYVVFARPYRGHQGYLIIGPEQRPLVINESQPNRSQVLPMRLDRELITASWIFGISIYQSEGLILLEDCIVANGEQLRSSLPYSQRLAQLHKFATHTWFADKRFQLEWEIRVAPIYSLAEIETVVQEAGTSGNVCLMPELPTLRLIKVIQQQAKPQPGTVASKNLKEGQQCLICSPVIGKPDVYELKANDGSNRDLGRASVQTLALSKLLAEKSSTHKSWLTIAEWNEDFEAFTITSIL